MTKEPETKSLHDLEVAAYLADTVRIEPLALEEEFIRMPADLAYWNERYAQAVRGFLTAKIECSQVNARLHLEIRTRLTAAASTAATVKGDKSKGPTVGDIDAAVDMEPDMQAVRQKELDAEVEKVRLGGVIDAVRAKRDMLIQLGARARIEMESDPVIREQIRVNQAKRVGL